MRTLVLCSTLLASLAIPAAAYADSFTFTPTGGPATTFTLDASQADGSLAAHGFYYDPTSTSTGGATSSDSILVFYNPATYAAAGKGPLDFFLYDDVSGFSGYFSGAILYSGSESAPTFLPGTYDLDANTLFCACAATTGTLVIAEGDPADPVAGDPSTPSAVTPEPSSLILLGTGALGLLGAARRRFPKA